MEQVASLGEGAAAELPASLAPQGPANTLDLFAQVDAELERASTLGPGARRDLADSLNQRLLSLPKDGGRPVADALLRLLEGGKLGAVIDSEGRTARAAAAEALVGLGYPYALELAPDDLDHLRAGGGFKTPTASLVTALTLVVALAGLEAVAGNAQGMILAQLHAGLTVASALAVAATRPITRARGWAVISLLVAGVEGVLLGVLGTPAALLSGLAAVIAAALMSKKR